MQKSIQKLLQGHLEFKQAIEKYRYCGLKTSFNSVLDLRSFKGISYLAIEVSSFHCDANQKDLVK